MWWLAANDGGGWYWACRPLTPCTSLPRSRPRLSPPTEPTAASLRTPWPPLRHRARQFVTRGHRTQCAKDTSNSRQRRRENATDQFITNAQTEKEVTFSPLSLTSRGWLTGSSNRPRLIMSSGGVTRNPGGEASNNLCKLSPSSLAQGPWAPYSVAYPSFNIWRGGPPGRRTNRPTWQVPGCQAVQSAPAY